MKNNALKALLEKAKKDGVKNSETTKQNIYQAKYFEGVTNQKEEKKIRYYLRDNVLSYLQLIVSAKDKKEFAANYAKFEEVYKDTYINQNIDFSIFDTLRKEVNIKLVASAKEVIAKYEKK